MQRKLKSMVTSKKKEKTETTEKTNITVESITLKKLIDSFVEPVAKECKGDLDFEELKSVMHHAEATNQALYVKLSELRNKLPAGNYTIGNNNLNIVVPNVILPDGTTKTLIVQFAKIREYQKNFYESDVYIKPYAAPIFNSFDKQLEEPDKNLNEGIQCEDGLSIQIIDYLPNASLEDKAKELAEFTNANTDEAHEIFFSTVTNYGLQLLQIVKYAQERGIILTDLKPGNVLVTYDPQGNERLVFADPKGYNEEIVLARKKTLPKDLLSNQLFLSMVGDTATQQISKAGQYTLFVDAGRYDEHDENPEQTRFNLKSAWADENRYGMGNILYSMFTGKTVETVQILPAWNDKTGKISYALNPDFNFDQDIFKTPTGQLYQFIIKNLCHDDPTKRLNLEILEEALNHLKSGNDPSLLLANMRHMLKSKQKEPKKESKKHRSRKSKLRAHQTFDTGSTTTTTTSTSSMRTDTSIRSVKSNPEHSIMNEQQETPENTAKSTPLERRSVKINKTLSTKSTTTSPERDKTEASIGLQQQDRLKHKEHEKRRPVSRRPHVKVYRTDTPRKSIPRYPSFKSDSALQKTAPISESGSPSSASVSKQSSLSRSHFLNSSQEIKTEDSSQKISETPESSSSESSRDRKRK